MAYPAYLTPEGGALLLNVFFGSAPKPSDFRVELLQELLVFEESAAYYHPVTGGNYQPKTLTAEPLLYLDEAGVPTIDLGEVSWAMIYPTNTYSGSWGLYAGNKLLVVGALQPTADTPAYTNDALPEVLMVPVTVRLGNWG